MGALSAIFSGLALAGISKMTAPKMPKAKAAPTFDFDAETANALAARRSSEDPQLRDLLSQNIKTAASLSRGEIPAEIEATLRRVAAENTTMRGLSKEQGTRLTAQALGKTQADLMAQGAQLTQLVQAIEQNEWSTAADSALSKANLLYTNYANQERYRLAAYEQDAKQHSALFSGLISGVSSSLMSSNAKSLKSLTSGTSRRAQLAELDAQDWWGTRKAAASGPSWGTPNSLSLRMDNNF